MTVSKLMPLFMLDPDSNNCDTECGAVTEASVARHIACRQQCILPDFAGIVCDMMMDGQS